MPATRLLDLKLKCIFELTESDQQRLQSQQQAVGNDTTTIKSNESGVKSSGKSASNVSSSSISKDTFVQAASDFDSTYVQKTAAANTTAAPVSSRLDKNDNTLNELKLLRQENDNLKKEVARLKVWLIRPDFVYSSVGLISFIFRRKRHVYASSLFKLHRAL